MSTTTKLTENQAQQQAILAPTTATVCLIAGAGTGKTETLSQRYVHVLRSHPELHPRNLVVLTFTDKAATEMRARILYAVRAAGLPFTGLDMAEAQISTFHAFAAKLALRRSIPLNLDPDTPFCDETEYTMLADACWEDFLRDGWQSALAQMHHHLAYYNWNDDQIRKEVFGIIADLKGLGYDAEHVRTALSNDTALSTKHALYAHMLIWNFGQRAHALHTQGRLDLDEIIGIIPTLIQHHPELRQHIRFVLVDEYQDTNTAQAQLLESITPHHAGRPHSRTVAGDPRQAIYVWRQANVQNIADINAQSDRSIYLSDNWRSTSPILTVANRSLAAYRFGNPPEFNPQEQLIAARGDGEIAPDTVILSHFEGRDQEASAVAQRILELHQQHGVAFADMAILLRGRTHIATYVAALEAANIPYDRGKDDPFFLRADVRNMIHLVAAIANPTLEHSLVRTVHQCLGILDEAGLHSIRQQHPKSTLWEALIQSSTQMPALHALKELVEVAHQWKWQISPTDWMLRIFHASGYWQSLNAYGQRMAKKLIQEMHATQPADVDTLVATLLFRLEHRPICLTPELIGNPDAVQMMTVHSAKGLEYTAIFVVDAHAFTTKKMQQMTSHKGRIVDPDCTALQQDEISEISRINHNETQALWYVALTRAKRWLMVSAPRRRRNTSQSDCFTDLLTSMRATTDVEWPGIVFAYQPAQVRVLPTPHHHIKTSTHATATNLPTGLKSKQIIQLSPSSLHEITQCPRRFRYQRRSGFAAMMATESLGPTRSSILPARTLIVGISQTNEQTESHESEHGEAVRPHDTLEAGRDARLIGILLHAACELHASHPDATAAQLYHLALQNVDESVSTVIADQVIGMITRYVQSELGRTPPLPSDVEQRIIWNVETSDAVIELSGIIDRWYQQGIVDYKTDESLQGLAERHGDQLRLYALAIMQINGLTQPPALSVYHARSGTLIPIDASAAALQQTRQHLQQAAHHIVNGSYPARPQPAYCAHCPALAHCADGMGARSQPETPTTADTWFDW